MENTQGKAPGFTPGPYRAHPYSIKDGCHVRFEIVAKNFDGEEYVVARTADDGSRVGEATANLLAASPDLYAALREAEAEFDGAARFYRNEMAGFVGSSIAARIEACAKKARAALAKAEGRQA